MLVGAGSSHVLLREGSWALIVGALERTGGLVVLEESSIRLIAVCPGAKGRDGWKHARGHQVIKGLD